MGEVIQLGGWARCSRCEATGTEVRACMVLCPECAEQFDIADTLRRASSVTLEPPSDDGPTLDDVLAKLTERPS